MRCSSDPDLCGWMGAVYEMRSYIERTQTGPDFWTADSSPARGFRYPDSMDCCCQIVYLQIHLRIKTLVYPGCTSAVHRHFASFSAAGGGFRDWKFLLLLRSSNCGCHHSRRYCSSRLPRYASGYSCIDRTV